MANDVTRAVNLISTASEEHWKGQGLKAATDNKVARVVYPSVIKHKKVFESQINGISIIDNGAKSHMQV